MGLVGIIILVIIGAIIVFLICRELVCWYLKINEMVELLREQNRHLSKIAGAASSQGSTSGSGTISMFGNKRQKKCTRCSREIDEDYSSCPHCGNNTFE